MDSVSTVMLILENVFNLSVGWPLLYFDLERINLSRHRSLSIIFLCLLPFERST